MSNNKILLWLSIFSIAMGYLESAVVVYLRAIYYPSGFAFPMVSLTGNIAVTEVFREAATMFMLFSVAFLAGTHFRQRFAWFLYCFAIWDIFYYVFLKWLINWPETLFTWDILFLIPVVWTGPVIAPVIVSITMIITAILMVFDNGKRYQIKIGGMIITGALLIFLSMVWDFSVYFIERFSFPEIFRYSLNQHALEQYVPKSFNWWLFIAGEAIILTSVILQYKQITLFKRT